MGCCCGPSPCCKRRLFRADGRNLPALTLTLESRQSWWVLNPETCDYLGGGIARASLMHTTVLSSQELTLTYQRPIPSGIYTGLLSEQPETLSGCVGPPSTSCSAPKGSNIGASSSGGAFFNPLYGWYVSSSVPYGTVSGDSIWTGGLQQRTGKYFLAMLDKYSCSCNPTSSEGVLTLGHYCCFGFMFDSDVDLTTTGSSNCSKAAWLAYIGARNVNPDPGPLGPPKPSYTGQIVYGTAVDFRYGTYSNAPGTTSQSLNKAIFRTTASGHFIRGVEFPVGGGSGWGGGAGECRPYLLETQLIHVVQGTVAYHQCVNPDCEFGVDENGNCLGGTTPANPAPSAGIYLNAIRGAEIGEDGECEQNTLNTTEANVPTTTAAITALSATHACEEMLWMHATISEP